jgi:Fe2+ transport system protein B
MNTAVIHVHPSGPLVALFGNPNCGKTALFNLLTGSRQKVANYVSTTVERKEGRHVNAAGKTVRVLDLPVVVALNKADRAEQQGIGIDVERLSAELGVPVVRTVGVMRERRRAASRTAGRSGVVAACGRARRGDGRGSEHARRSRDRARHPAAPRPRSPGRA